MTTEEENLEEFGLDGDRPKPSEEAPAATGAIPPASVGKLLTSEHIQELARLR